MLDSCDISHAVERSSDCHILQGHKIIQISSIVLLETRAGRVLGRKKAYRQERCSATVVWCHRGCYTRNVVRIHVPSSIVNHPDWLRLAIKQLQMYSYQQK